MKKAFSFNVESAVGDGRDLRDPAMFRLLLRATRLSRGQGQGPAYDLLPAGQARHTHWTDGQTHCQ